jgi:hypothetical protein
MGHSPQLIFARTLEWVTQSQTAPAHLQSQTAPAHLEMRRRRICGTFGIATWTLSS